MHDDFEGYRSWVLERLEVRVFKEQRDNMLCMLVYFGAQHHTERHSSFQLSFGRTKKEMYGVKKKGKYDEEFIHEASMPSQHSRRELTLKSSKKI
jgi:hypothetical protein